MKTEEFRDLVDAVRHSGPFVITTRGGRTYEVENHSRLWLPDIYPNTVCVAVRGKGITLLDIHSIEGIVAEPAETISRGDGS